MRLTTLAALIFCAALGANLCADDFGDAPASYGTLACWIGTDVVRLGAVAGDDTTNPVSPAWTGDNDDGVVGTPLWNPVSWDNQLTVHVGGPYGGWLMLWVDADDNGTWDASEYYLYSTIYAKPGADYTFTGIRLNRPQGFSLNGPNKVAVRIVVQDNWGPVMHASPTGFFYMGEVEDWLIDCTPGGFAITTPVVRDQVETKPGVGSLKCAGGTPPYTWSQTGGALPAGLSLVQTGNDFVLSGTPAAGTGTGAPLYSFSVQVTDALSAVAQRSYQVRVMPPPYVAPYVDSFSANTGWVLGNTWSWGTATAYAGLGTNYVGETCSEPGQDATPASTDNMILADSMGGPFTLGQDIYDNYWAVSPIIDCAALTTVELRFKRWVSSQIGYYVTGGDRLKVQVSANGTNWTNVWNSSQQLGGEGAIVDNAWTLMQYDISAVAAGQSQVRIRFGVGPCMDTSVYPTAMAPQLDDFAGWCVDDLRVGAPPANGLQVSGFTLNSPMSFQHPYNMVTYPVGMKNYTHTWQAVLANPGTQAVDVDSIEVGISWLLQPGATDYHTVNFHSKHQSWYDAGSWTLTAPVTVAAGASGITISGTLACNGLTAQLANQVMRCKLFVRGAFAGGGQMVESTTGMDCVFNHNPLGLHVHEQPSGGAVQGEVGYGETATGLRNFGSAAIGGGSSGWVNFICKTNSSSPFTVSVPTLTGTDAGQFEIYAQSPWVNQPAAGQSNVWFAVRFKPTSLGVKSAWVEFVHTAPNAATPFTFEVRGTGVGSAPILGLMELNPYTGNTIGNGATATGERDFGQVDITGTAPTPREFYITNTGTQPLNLGTPSLAGGAGMFSLDLTQFSNSVPAGYHTTLVVQYAPSALGLHSAWITFSHNDTGTTNPFTFEVKGEGVVNAPVIEVRLGGPFGTMIASGTPASGQTQFPALDIGTSSAPLLLHVRNLGLVDLVLASTTLTGTHSGDFALNTTGMAATLATGAATTFEVAFAPVAKGPKAAAIAIVHNDTQTGTPFLVPLAGIGLDPNGVVFTTAPVLPAAKIGDLYSAALAASGGTAPYSYALISGALPTGVTLASDGTLSGTPMGAYGVFTFRVRVTDALLGQEERQFDLPVQPPPGHVEKATGKAGSGCAATGGIAVGWWWLGLLPLLALRRRRNRA